MEFGPLLGYARWMYLIEIVSEKMDETDRCHAEYSSLEWGRLLKLKQKKLETFIKLCENFLGILVERNENIIKISIPNLLKKKDNHSKNLQAKSKSLASIEVEVDKDKRYNPPIVPPSPTQEKLNGTKSRTNRFDQKSGFEIFWKDWPNKADRAKAQKRFKILIKNQKDHDRLMFCSGKYQEFVAYQRAGPQPDLDWRHGATFLSTWDGWEDWEPPVKPASQALPKKSQKELDRQRRLDEIDKEEAEK